MSIFDTEFAEDLHPALSEELDTEVTLKGTHVDDLTVNAVSISPAVGSEAADDSGREAVRTRTVGLAAADVSNPGAWNLIEIAGQDWTVEQPPESESDSLIVFRVSRTLSRERSRSGYRS